MRYGKECLWCRRVGYHDKGCPMRLAHEPVPASGRLLGPDGTEAYRFQRMVGTNVRVMRLDADGQPVGPSMAFPGVAVMTTEHRADLPCRCGDDRRLHTGEGGSCERFSCQCTRYRPA